MKQIAVCAFIRNPKSCAFVWKDFDELERFGNENLRLHRAEVADTI